MARVVALLVMSAIPAVLSVGPDAQIEAREISPDPCDSEEIRDWAIEEAETGKWFYSEVDSRCAALCGSPDCTSDPFAIDNGTSSCFLFPPYVNQPSDLGGYGFLNRPGGICVIFGGVGIGKGSDFVHNIKGSIILGNGSDCVVLADGGVKINYIDTGLGDDTVLFDPFDEVTVKVNHIDTGDGSDIVILGGAKVNVKVVHTGGDSDYVYLFGGEFSSGLKQLSLFTEDDDDEVYVLGTSFKKIDLGLDDDLITLVNAGSGRSKVVGGNGDDAFVFATSRLNSIAVGEGDFSLSVDSESFDNIPNKFLNEDGTICFDDDSSV